MSVDPQAFATRLAVINKQIIDACQQNDRDANSVQLLAVSKQQSCQDICHAYDAGLRQFAENYCQEALEKIAALSDKAIIWHFIGALQSNKTKKIAEHFDWVHTIDKLSIAERLNKQRPSQKDRLSVCIQVNISNEASKSGVASGEVESLAQAIMDLPRLKLRGLMAIPRASEEFQQQYQTYQRLASLFIQLKQQGLPLDTLSMGMSNDFAAAIAAGATYVRIGTALFGPRDKKSQELNS